MKDRDIELYIERMSSPMEDLLAELDRQTNLRAIQPQMISGPVQGKLLELLTRMINPRNVLEIGTFTGYSTLCFAAGMDACGTIDTIEVDDEVAAFAGSFFERFELCRYFGQGGDGCDDDDCGQNRSNSQNQNHGQNRGRSNTPLIRQHIGPALEIAPGLGEVYDLVFIDGDKREYPDYYRMIMGDGGSCGNTCPLVKSGSIILSDNILWYGKVVAQVAANDLHTAAIHEFNRMVREDPRVENVILPLRDGINFIRVK